MLRRASLWIVALATLALSGCAGTAVIVSQTPVGGVLGLEGDHAEAMADARRQMSEHCRGAYRILGEHDSASTEVRGQGYTERHVEFACGAEPDRPAVAPR